MHLHTNRPDLLILRYRPWFFFIITLFFVLTFAAATLSALGSDSPGQAIPMFAGCLFALGMMWFLVRPARLVADTQAGTVEVLRISLRGKERVVFPLDEVAKAGIKSSGGGMDTSRQAWMSLYLDKGDMKGWHRVTSPSPVGNPRRGAQYFNAWIKSYKAHAKR